MKFNFNKRLSMGTRPLTESVDLIEEIILEQLEITVLLWCRKCILMINKGLYFSRWTV